MEQPKHSDAYKKAMDELDAAERQLDQQSARSEPLYQLKKLAEATRHDDGDKQGTYWIVDIPMDDQGGIWEKDFNEWFVRVDPEELKTQIEAIVSASLWEVQHTSDPNLADIDENARETAKAVDAIAAVFFPVVNQEANKALGENHNERTLH